MCLCSPRPCLIGFMSFTPRGCPIGYVDRPSGSQLGPLAGVCLSSVSYSMEGIHRRQGLGGPGNVSDYPILATTRVVPGSPRPPLGTSSQVASSQGPVETTSRAQVSPRSPNASYSCLETVLRIARHAVFSARVAIQVALARCNSPH